MRATDRVERRAAPAPRGSAHILATAKGGGFLAAGTLFEYATRFLIGLLLARGLGAHGYGLYVLSISVASLFAGISLVGTDDAMVRYVAILSSRKDAAGVGGTLQIGAAAALVGGCGVGLLLFVFAAPIATGLFSSPELETTLRLMAVLLPFLAASNTLLGMARGFKRMDIAAYSENGVQSLVRLGLIAGLALTGHLTVVPALLAFGIADVAAGVTLVLLLNREFAWRGLVAPGLRRDVREVFGFAFPLWIAGAASAVPHEHPGRARRVARLGGRRRHPLGGQPRERRGLAGCAVRLHRLEAADGAAARPGRPRRARARCTRPRRAGPSCRTSRSSSSWCCTPQRCCRCSASSSRRAPPRSCWWPARR